MNIKKIFAAVVTAAVLAVAAPMTGVLPDTLGVVASAAEYKVGDEFYAAFNRDTGEVIGEPSKDWDAISGLSSDLLSCKVLSDTAVAVHYTPSFGVMHSGGAVVYPSKVGTYTVTELDEQGVYGLMDSITIPDTVTTIGHSAFLNNIFLKEVKFGANSQLKLIDQWAFQNCRSLKSITIPANVETIAYGAFLNANSDDYKLFDPRSDADYSDIYSLENVSFAEGSKLKTIGEYAFQDQKELTSIAIPESTDSIAANAFEGSALKNIDGVADSYAEKFAKENGYTFNGISTEMSEKFTDDSSDKAADVEVLARPNVIPKEAHFSVRLDDANTTAERIAYNCYFTYNGAEYEPTDTVVVRIPVPVAMRDISDTLKVYHLQDGKYVKMKTKIENGYLVFDTDHFSTYVVTAEVLSGDVNGDGRVNAKDAAAVLRHAADLEKLTGDALTKADTNADGKINAADATVILMISAGLI